MKCRNESAIIADTIEHYSQWCSKMVIFDDDSTDNTREIIKKYPQVILIEGEAWSMEDRPKLESKHRQIVLDRAKEIKPDFILFADADERIEQWPEIDDYHESFSMRLFDAYITEGDKNLDYTKRSWFGPEVREIINLIRTDKIIGFHGVDQRIPECNDTMSVTKAGYIKHYGKAISVDEWEDTCEYYSKWPEPYKSKWEARRGKAIHDKSDFGRPLYPFNHLLNNPEKWVFID